MKTFLTLLLSVFGIAAMAQEQSFKITAQKQIVTAYINGDNTNKKIVINTSEKIANVQRMMIRSLRPELDAEWKRTFAITDDNDKAEFTFTDEKSTGVFTISLKELADTLKKGQRYKLYTMAIPLDPAKAAIVRVKRILIATIEVQ